MKDSGRFILQCEQKECGGNFGKLCRSHRSNAPHFYGKIESSADVARDANAVICEGSQAVNNRLSVNFENVQAAERGQNGVEPSVGDDDAVTVGVMIDKGFEQEREDGISVAVILGADVNGVGIVQRVEK